MKKILIFSMFILASLFSAGQNETFDALLGYDETFKIYPGQSADQITTGDSIWDFNIQKLTDRDINAYVYVSLDSIAGTASDVYVILGKKVFDSESFTPLDTVTWAMSADTSFVITTSSSQNADKWQLRVKGSTDEITVGIDELNFKFLK